MSYVLPGVLVYQQLASSGGVANVTPDLDACIFGPCYNVVDYDATSAASLTASAALDATGNAVSITNNSINTVVYLPSQKVGQNLDESSVKVYLNSAKVLTLQTKFTANPSENDLIVAPATSACHTTSGSNILTAVTSASHFAIGDPITITGAGASGADLVTTISDVGATTITIPVDALTTSSSSTVTKNEVSNINTASATERISKGFAAKVTYHTSSNVVKTFATTVIEVVTDDNKNLTQISTADMLPSDVPAESLVLVEIIAPYNNQFLAEDQYDASTVGATSSLTILPLPQIVYGTIISAEVHIAYRALRLDLAGSVLDINSPDDLEGTLGYPSDRNPLALGVQIAMANTVGRVRCVTVESEDLLGYQSALELTENTKIYSLVPLSTDTAILSLFATHAGQMSTAEAAMWRVALLSSSFQATTEIGPYNANSVNANQGNNAISAVNGRYILTSSNATFITDGVIPGDLIKVTAGSTNSGTIVGTYQVLNVISNQQVQIQATKTGTAISYYVSRNLTKTQQASRYAGISTTLGDKRAYHTPQYAGITIDGVIKYLPGYYLMCAVAGLVAGLPAQAGLTNIGIAGIDDIKYGNFYFTQPQLNTMAAAGTWLFSQESKGTIPYIRHELSTDMTVFEYRELQQVKNLDYLSYFYHDIMKGFIGKWNITEDTLVTIRQTMNSGGELLKTKKLPRVGAPLIAATISKLEQSPTSKDSVNCVVQVNIPDVLNYLNLYLVA